MRDLDRVRRRRGAPRARRQALGRVVALHQLARVRLFQAVALVVDDEHRATGLAREHVERPAHEHLVVEQEREALLAADVGGRRQPLAHLAAR